MYTVTVAEAPNQNAQNLDDECRSSIRSRWGCSLNNSIFFFFHTFKGCCKAKALINKGQN